MNSTPLFAAIVVPRFAAQALVAARPDLRGKPFVVVEQDPESHKTAVLDLSAAAAREGEARHVWPGLPLFLALRKWPGLPVLPRDPAAEARLRARLTDLWTRCTPAFTARGNGGAVLDLTGTPLARRFPEALSDRDAALAARLRAEVMALGLEAVSVGTASSHIVARVLARLEAPDGVAACPAGEETRALDPLAPSLLPGLSPAARERLRKYGLVTIGAVRRLGKEELTLRFGAEGERLYALARGVDVDPARETRKPVEAETVLAKDLNDEGALRDQVRLTADKLGHALRREGVKASRFTMVLAYSDGRSARRTVRVQPPTAAFALLAEEAVPLFFELYQRRVALRRIRLSVAAPALETGQRDLFEEAGRGKREALEAAIDRIRAKRAFTAVLSGSNVGKEAKNGRRPAARKKG
jgi:DNA polymerase-4